MHDGKHACGRETCCSCYAFPPTLSASQAQPPAPSVAAQAAQAELATLRVRHEELLAQYRRASARISALEEAAAARGEASEAERSLAARLEARDREVARLTAEVSRLGAELADLQELRQR